MAAYLIFALDITDPEGFREYAERVGPTHEHYGGKLLFDALDTGTTLAKIRVQGTASTFYGLADFLMAPMVKRNLNNDLRRLKAKMESE
jgi:hypothetical protein